MNPSKSAPGATRMLVQISPLRKSAQNEILSASGHSSESTSGRETLFALPAWNDDKRPLTEGTESTEKR